MKDLRQHRFRDEGQPASFAADRLKQRRNHNLFIELCSSESIYFYS